MQIDFHYYATYCAAVIAGYSCRDSEKIAWCAQFVDRCTKTFLDRIGGPVSAATTQLQLEMMEADTSLLGLQEITRIWASFHFLPGDLYAQGPGKCSRRFLHKYRLICNTDSELLVDTVELARAKGPEAAGIAMHVLADTWAHRYFAGTPSLVINNTGYYFYEIMREGDREVEKAVKFNHNPVTKDRPDRAVYTNTMYQGTERSMMNLGHGRAGHLPDYSYARYRYMPSWGGYMEIMKDNPLDYMHAFCQMIYALKSLRDPDGRFETGHYDREAIRPWEETIRQIFEVRRLLDSEDWKKLGVEISGRALEDFDEEKYEKEYVEADQDSRDDTVLGRFIMAALAQKSMVTSRIFSSGSLLAGYPADYRFNGLKDIRDFFKNLIDKGSKK